MFKRTILVLLLAPWGLSSGVFGQQPTTPDQLLVERAVVLSPPSEGPDNSCTNAALVPTPSATWTPDSDQLRSLDRALGQTIADSLGGRHLSLPKVADYYRQYVPIVAHGRRLIFVNGFEKHYFWAEAQMDSVQGRPTSRDDWKKHLVCVFDGGENFFTAVFDPATGRVERFGFNGVE